MCLCVVANASCYLQASFSQLGGDINTELLNDAVVKSRSQNVITDC